MSALLSCSDDCEVDDDCGHHGSCLRVTHFSYPQKQCFCQPGYFGLHCENGKANDHIVLRTLMCAPVVKYEMLGLAAKYGLSDVREGFSVIRDSVWSCFVQKVQL